MRTRWLFTIYWFVSFFAGFSQETSTSHNRLISHLTYLASDELEGRGVGTAGIDSAAAYIAREFKEIGLKSGGDDETYFQKMETTIGVRLGQKNRFSINDQKFEINESFVPLGFSDNAEMTGQLVFVGYGIVAPEYNYNDFEGFDVAGKIALILCHEPGEKDSNSVFDGINTTIHSELRTKAIHAKTKGAIGVIFVNGPKYHSNDEPLPPIREDTGYHNVGIPVLQVTQERLTDVIGEDKLAELQNMIEADGKPHSQPLTDFTAKLITDLLAHQVEIKNVIGILIGTDESLQESPLIIGAHYDHLGYGGPASRVPDVRAIHNGADDNASGVAALIETAASLVKQEQPLKRSVVFIAFTGEEMGLIGSSYYVDHPLFPIENTIAMLNLDTIGRMVNNKLIIFGGGTAKEWERIINGYNHQYRFDLALQMDGYGPSDQASFYAREIPVLHFFTGANMDYHRPSDDVDKINFKDIDRITAFVTGLGEYLANREEPLTYSASGRVASAMPSGRHSGQGGSKMPWLGTVPDFSYQAGDGLKLSGVSPGSPIEKVGLQAGDLIIQIDDVQIKSIYELTHVLRNHKPGDEVNITYLRNGEKNSVKAILGMR